VGQGPVDLWTRPDEPDQHHAPRLVDQALLGTQRCQRLQGPAERQDYSSRVALAQSVQANARQHRLDHCVDVRDMLRPQHYLPCAPDFGRGVVLGSVGVNDVLDKGGLSRASGSMP
jgi:hypothetical protein